MLVGFQIPCFRCLTAPHDAVGLIRLLILPSSEDGKMMMGMPSKKKPGLIYPLVI